MKVVGYANKLSLHPGENIDFMVSCQNETYHADIVRLIHGDTSQDGPGFKEEYVKTNIEGEYKGQVQEIRNGSYVAVPDTEELKITESLTLQAWIYPTTTTLREQTILGKWSGSDSTGYRMLISENGCLGLAFANSKTSLKISSDVPMRDGVWYFAAVTYDAEKKQVAIYQIPLTIWPNEPSLAQTKTNVESIKIAKTDVPFMMAAHSYTNKSSEFLIDAKYNGKIDSPKIYSCALTEDEVYRLKNEAPANEVGDGNLVSAWTFTTNFSSSEVDDISGHGHNGMVINRPYRAMTGHLWRGQEQNYKIAPELYGAIHFHDDHLDDAGWEVGFKLKVPSNLRSGVYAARLKSNDAEDYIPFFVRPPKQTSTAPILFLVPTNSYLAYANFHWNNPGVDLTELFGDDTERKWDHPATDPDKYMVNNKLRSLYDRHTDGSGVAHSSMLRPILNMRPKYISPLLNNMKGAPHQFNADLHLTDWLEQMGHEFDVATDEDLHLEGSDLLKRYQVVLSGSHPEYWTGEMLDYLEEYLVDGGRHMYLGGNGYYWVTSYGTDSTHSIEVRRHRGTEAWEAAPGEYYHQSTGELGGLWRFRGRPPQQLVGVGFTSQGFDVSNPYRKSEESKDPRVAFIMQGVDEGEEFGDYGLVQGGAGGFEIDRADIELGTPPHALVLATTDGFSDVYQHVIEEVLLNDGLQGGTVNPLVRGDMVYYEGPNNGAVFSTGSISWCGSLSHNNYNNDVSKITDNVLKRFVSEE